MIVGLIAVACAGLACAQGDQSAIEQSRLYDQTRGLTTPQVDSNGTALPQASDTPTDESFGAQQILKQQQRPRYFTLTGDVFGFHTDNAALTRNATRGDELLVADFGAAWMAPIAQNLQGQLVAHGSVFRYDEISALDFQSVGVGAGIAYTPPQLPGVNIFARYDFTDLTNRHSRELLSDHEFSAGVQKAFALGRTQGFSIGLLGSAGISDPHAAQRDQIAAFATYHVQVTRDFGVDLGYRVAGYFYNSGGRDDGNQVVSLSGRFRFNEWVDANVFASFADNRSSREQFDYSAFTTGIGAAVTIRF